jgi:hypothetical protein
MSLITLTSASGNWAAADLPAKREFKLAAAGQAGQGSLSVPWDSPLADTLSPEGLDLVTIAHPTAGDWLGIVTSVSYAPDGITLSLMQPWGLLGRLIVNRGDTVSNVWPGYIANVALRAASLGGMVTLFGAAAGDTPLIPSYQFGFGDAWAVLTAMMDASDGEVSVDAATGVLDWGGALAGASAYGPLLVAGSTLRDWHVTNDAGDMLSEVIGIYPGGSYTASYADTAVRHWPAQASVSGPTARQTRELAERELDRRAFPATTIAGSVTYDNADLRENDRVGVFVPWLSRSYVCRVLGRALDDTVDTIALTLQVMPDGATTRVPPPGRGSQARGRGYGSVGTRILRMSRGQG